MDKLTQLIRQLGEPVLYETGGNQEYISPNIYSLTGYYAEEIRVNRDLFPGLINPEDYIETNFKIKNWHKNNEPGILSLCFRFQSSNGSQVWIEDYLIGLQDGDRKFMQGLMLEITAQKLKETELLQRRTEWRENQKVSDQEREKMFVEIEKELSVLREQEKERHARAENLLQYTKENKLKFGSLDLSFLNAR